MQPDMQMQTPTPPKAPRTRSVVGPVILIVLGLAFLAQNLGLFEWNIWGLLWRLWPVWLIAVGLEILIGRRHVWGSWVVLGLVLAVIGGSLWFDLTAVGRTLSAGEPVVISEALHGQERAEITLDSGVARLNVSAGAAANLVEGTVIPLETERIEQDARNIGDTLRFTLRSQSRSMVLPVNLTSERPTWDLKLSNQVPLSLHVDTGVGETYLDLTGLQVTDLKVDAGVGNTEIRLPEAGRFRVEIDAGVGEVTVRIPKGLAARIRADQGIGQVRVSGEYERDNKEYVSPNFSGAENRVEIDIDGGVGEIRIVEG